MIKIALCDDCEKDREAILYCLKRMEEEKKLTFDKYIFESGASLCESIAEGGYEIVLLDIRMDGIDGIETARRIRAMGENPKLIFISSYDDKLRELFSLSATAFIDKPLQYGDLETALLRACHMLQEEKETIFCYSKNGSSYFVPIKDILYFESSKNLVIIHTVRSDISFTQSLVRVWEDVKQYDVFIRPSKSYIINLKHFYIKQNSIELNKKEVINIGRSYKEETMNRYLNYMNRRIGK